MALLSWRELQFAGALIHDLPWEKEKPDASFLSISLCAAFRSKVKGSDPSGHLLSYSSAIWISVTHVTARCDGPHNDDAFGDGDVPWQG